jgi:hypothetical protein
VGQPRHSPHRQVTEHPHDNGDRQAGTREGGTVTSGAVRRASSPRALHPLPSLTPPRVTVLHGDTFRPHQQQTHLSQATVENRAHRLSSRTG